MYAYPIIFTNLTSDDLEMTCNIFRIQCLMIASIKCHEYPTIFTNLTSHDGDPWWHWYWPAKFHAPSAFYILQVSWISYIRQLWPYSLTFKFSALMNLGENYANEVQHKSSQMRVIIESFLQRNLIISRTCYPPST